MKLSNKLLAICLLSMFGLSACGGSYQNKLNVGDVIYGPVVSGISTADGFELRCVLPKESKALLYNGYGWVSFSIYNRRYMANCGDRAWHTFTVIEVDNVETAPPLAK